MHAYLPPSGSDAWVHCAQWPAMNALYPSIDSDESVEGRAAHWARAELLRGNHVAEGQVSEDGTVLTAEMVTLAYESVARAPALTESWNETTIPIHGIHAECFGTPDRFGWVAPRRLRIEDYKFGHGYVDAFQNWQLITYARGVLDFLGINGHDEHRIEIELAIDQPRNYNPEGPLRSWTVDATDLRPYWNMLEAAAMRATSDERVATPGAHCLHCPGRLACTTLQKSAYRILAVAGQPTPFDLDPMVAAKELNQLEEAAVMLKARIDGLRSEVQAAFERGQRGLGYTLDRSPGRLNWTIDPDKAIGLGQMYGVDLSKPDAKTPTQAIAAGLDPKVVSRFAARSFGAAALVKTDQSFAYRAFFKR